MAKAIKTNLMGFTGHSFVVKHLSKFENAEEEMDGKYGVD